MSEGLHYAPFLPERVVFIVDLDAEQMARASVTDPVTQKNVKTPLFSVIRALIYGFIRSKRVINKDHQYALALLSDSCIWVSDWTNNREVFARDFTQHNAQHKFQQCDVGTVYTAVADKMAADVDSDRYCYRAILVYARTHVQPQITESGMQQMAELASTNKFFLDVLYLHSKHDNEQESQTRQSLRATLTLPADAESGKTRSWFYSTPPFLNRLNEVFALFLYHPAQRPSPQVDRIDVQ